MTNLTKHPVIIAGTGPGDPELLTVKAYNAIQQADVIVYDSPQNEAVLDLKKPDALVVKLDKRKDIPGNEARKAVAETIAKYYKMGKRVVSLKVGDAFMFGRGATEMDFLKQLNVESIVIPGITAGIAAAGRGAVRITEKNEADMAVFYMAAQKTNQHENLTQLANILKCGATAIIYMAENRIGDIIQFLKKQGLSENFPVVAVSKTTLTDEQALTANFGTIVSELKTNHLQSPIVFFMGKYVRTN